MNVELIAFWGFAGAIILFALGATLSRHIVNAALCLLGALAMMAGIFVLLHADFLAVAQVVVYVGGIVVILIFGVLLTSRRQEDLIVRQHQMPVLAASLSLSLCIVLLTIIALAVWPLSPPRDLPGTTRPIGYLLLQNYILPFEFASVTLLAALVGASYLVRPRSRD